MFLPTLDGAEVMRRVRSDANPVVARVPILVMDVRHWHQSVLMAFRSGADDYLTMPYEVQDLLRCWQRVAGGVRRPSPLTALLNADVTIRQTAIAYLLEMRPEGIIDGLRELLQHPDPVVRGEAHWALSRLGTPEALAALRQGHPWDIADLL
jgi:CheY-like chemotaxis protein